jgi:hypothetical protein
VWASVSAAMTRVAMSVGMGGVAEMENEGEGGRKQRLLMVFAAAADEQVKRRQDMRPAPSLFSRASASACGDGLLAL